MIEVVLLLEGVGHPKMTETLLGSIHIIWRTPAAIQ